MDRGLLRWIFVTAGLVLAGLWLLVVLLALPLVPWVPPCAVAAVAAAAAI